MISNNRVKGLAALSSAKPFFLALILNHILRIPNRFKPQLPFSLAVIPGLALIIKILADQHNFLHHETPLNLY